MDAAVIDRIRGYADDGMSPARIATTLGIPLLDVTRTLVGQPMPEPRPDGNGTKRAPDSLPTPLPVALQSLPTAKQREIWRLVHDEGLTRVAAAAQLGIPSPTVRNQLMAYMKHMGITGDIPGASPQRGYVAGSRSAATPDTHTTSGTPDTLAGEPAPGEDDVAADPPSSPDPTPVVETDADHAEIIPEAIPGPAPATPAPATNTHETIVTSEAAPTEADLRARYAALLIRKAEANGAPSYDRLDRVLGVRDVDAWEAGRREGILLAIEAVSKVWFTGQADLIAKLCRVALRPE